MQLLNLEKSTSLFLVDAKVYSAGYSIELAIGHKEYINTIVLS